MALPRLLPDLTVYTSNTTGVPSEAGTAYPLFPLSMPRLLPDLTVYTSNMTGVPSEAGTAYILQASEFFGGICAAHFCLFVMSYYVPLHSEFRVVMSA